jgi:hypothetical protein
MAVEIVHARVLVGRKENRGPARSHTGTYRYETPSGKSQFLKSLSRCTSSSTNYGGVRQRRLFDRHQCLSNDLLLLAPNDSRRAPNKAPIVRVGCRSLWSPVAIRSQL